MVVCSQNAPFGAACQIFALTTDEQTDNTHRSEIIHLSPQYKRGLREWVGSSRVQSLSLFPGNIIHVQAKKSSYRGKNTQSKSIFVAAVAAAAIPGKWL